MGLKELASFVREGADPALLDEAFFVGEVALVGGFLLEEASQLLDEVLTREMVAYGFSTSRARGSLLKALQAGAVSGRCQPLLWRRPEAS